MSNILRLALLSLSLYITSTMLSFAQEEEPAEPPKEETSTSQTANEESSEEKNDEESEEEKPETLEEVVEEMERFPGIFDLYRDTETGGLHMAIAKSQIDKEFLYFATIKNGVLEAWSRRGAPIAQDVIEIRRYFDRIDFVKKNTNYVIDPDSPLANGGMANITDAVLASAEIIATSEDENSYLISADGLFQTEALARVTYGMNPEQPPHRQFNIGKLSNDKVKYTHIGVYPENLNVLADFVYENSRPYMSGSARLADARATTISVQHSFVKMPENDFVPRLDDHRVGYFRAQATDLNSYEHTPYRDYINRFHLVKKDPDAALSEPVEPIVWWIENTTPLEYRERLKDGVLAWNSSFEKAGFKNAIVVKIQPDNVDWNAEDIRYNVIRFSNTPNAGSAFGPNYVNPRTGQILGGDVMFEHSFLSSYGFRGDVLANPDEFLKSFLASDDDGHEGHNHSSLLRCSKGYQMREMANFGYIALNAMNASVSDQRKIIEQMLMELMLHEVGHVIGLSHNMKASNFRSMEEVFNDKVTQGVTTASIMDYTALVISKPGEKQGDFFATKPGPYDDWAIQFGYDPALEGEAREAHLARSTMPELMFGNDADDMRSPGRGIDPRVNIWDMSSDSIDFAQYQFELVNEVTPLVKDKLAKDGETWAKLRTATRTMITYKAGPTAAVSSYIGGIEVTRFDQGQVSDVSPYQPLSKEKQKQAMNVLSEFIFAPNAFTLPQELIQHSLMQRRGFMHWGNTEDPKLHQLVLGVQKIALARLLNPTVMLRMSDTVLYGNTYTIEQMTSDLTDAIFEADIKSSINSHRRLLQTEYLSQLLAILDGESHDPIAKAAVFTQILKIQDWVSSGRVKDAASKAHRTYLEYLIADALALED
ncbi:zinc-dependent metalloprotease [Glaciecola petra]|uniref:Zinc-dependent metalloprotease n=1 Tax=Glaciecola petra TaxID=3075602 RepID=A0ABU2ZUL4_9ALTE|nr:zinc-dependent metalloprotease [Aestuariibacter sp. P117]MDT0595733.1 zinc-dependent metalloprotease [Aestuariibacter sp. P117]